MADDPTLIDISRHNTLTGQPVPGHVTGCVHKVNEGTKTDPKFAGRADWINERFRIRGGYTVLFNNRDLPGYSTIRRQMEIYVREVTPFWGDGWMTQLDVEPWAQYPHQVTADQIDEARAIHVAELGRDCATYINPNQMPATFADWAAEHPSQAERMLWLPNYSRSGSVAANVHQAIIHQYTSRWSTPAFTAGIDANHVLAPTLLDQLAGLDTKEDDMPSTAYMWKPKGYANVFLCGVGAIHQLTPLAYRELVDRDVLLIEDEDHDAMLRNVLHATGLTAADLTPLPAVELPVTE